MRGILLAVDSSKRKGHMDNRDEVQFWKLVFVNECIQLV